MRGKKTLIFALLILPAFLEASVIFDTSLPSARSAGLGGAITADGGYAPVLWKNPAGLAGIRGFQFISAQTQKFSLADLGQTNISAGFPTRIGAMGLGYSQTGGDIYKESVFSFAYSNTITAGTDFGMSAKTMNLSISEYGSATAAAIDIGVRSSVSQTLALGFSLSNANSPYLGVSRIPIRKNLSIGMNYSPAADATLAAELEKIDGHDIATKMGFEHLLTRGVRFRSGLRSNPTRFSFGLGFEPAGFLIDYAFITHPVLPVQHFLSVGVNFGGEGAGARRRRGGGKIAINKATTEELSEISDVMGRVTARKIVEYREKHGPFKSMEDIRKIPRIREATIRAMESLVTFEAPAAKEEKTPAPPEPPLKPDNKKYQEPTKIGEEPAGRPSVGRKTGKLSKQESPIPKPVENAQDAAVSLPAPATSKPSEETSAGNEDCLDVNSATEQEFQVLGFTATESKNIVRFRKRSGGFDSVDDLLKVPGINGNTFEKCREILRRGKTEGR